MAQTTPNTPLTRVNAGFESKTKLVELVKGLATDEMWLSRLNDAKPWSSISNSKLLRLHALITDAKARFGSRDKLIEALALADGHSKDADYRKRFAAWPLPRLMDALKSSEKRNGAAKKKAEAVAAKPATQGAGAEPGAKKGAKKGAAKADAKKGTEKKVAAAPSAGAKKGAKKGAAAAGAKKSTAKKK